jgi:fructose transport system permease protein
MGRLAVVNGVPVEFSFPLGLLTGIACGWVNGILVTRLKLPPFIVTLGTWSIFGALILFYSRSETLRQQDVEAVAAFLQWTGYALNDGLRGVYGFFKGSFGSESWPEWQFRFGGARITYGSILMIIIAVVVWYTLNRTAFGRHIYATGDDPDAARLAGINTDRVLVAVYTIAGLICAIGGWVLIGRIGAVSPLAGQMSNLDSITAVVIGGTSLFGGRGSIIGTLIGALIVGVFRNGLALAGLDALWQEFAVGVLIIVAVALDQWIRRVSA